MDETAREREQAHAELGKAREQLRSLGREKALLEERLGELGELRRRMAQLDGRQQRAVAGTAIVEQLAEAYRAVGPAIAATVRQQVVEAANRAYRQVAGRAARIEWLDDFGLSLVEGSGRRGFADLAGGEQATAALALELALLEQYPGVGLLLLDEPSAHLDPGRRRALADTLRRVCDGPAGDLEQVVVVSHDEAFEQVVGRALQLPGPA